MTALNFLGLFPIYQVHGGILLKTLQTHAGNTLSWPS